MHIEREDEYCALLLRVAAMCFQRYVAGGTGGSDFDRDNVSGGGAGIGGRHKKTQVPVNALSNTAEHMELVRRTARLRTAVQVEALVSTPATPVNAAGGNLFLDDG